MDFEKSLPKNDVRMSNVFITGMLTIVLHKLKEIMGNKFNEMSNMEKRIILEDNLYHMYGLRVDNFSTYFKKMIDTKGDK